MFRSPTSRSRTIPAPLEAGEVDLAMTLSAFGAISINKGDAVLFLHLFGGNFGKQEVGFIVTEKLIKEKSALVQRIVNAHVDSIKMFMGQPDKQIEFERKYSRLPDPVIAMQEREFLHYNFRTNVADIKTMAASCTSWVGSRRISARRSTASSTCHSSPRHRACRRLNCQRGDAEADDICGSSIVPGREAEASVAARIARAAIRDISRGDSAAVADLQRDRLRAAECFSAALGRSWRSGTIW